MSKSKPSLVWIVILLAMPVMALAQRGGRAVPPTVSSISPASATAGGAGFVLTVAGASFTYGSVVQWNGANLTTTFVSSTQLQASISGALVSVAGTAQITVFTGGRGGGTSNRVAFTIAPGSSGSTASTSTLAISTTSVAGGTVGTSYAATLAASGGTSPYSWSVSAGALPPGLSLSSSGAIGGTPTTGGSYSFTAEVADSASHTAAQAYSIVVSTVPSALAITTTSVPTGTAGTGYATALAASGGTPPHTWSVSSGALPPGLSISSSGAISGTPNASGLYSFTAQVADAASSTAGHTYSITIGASTTTPLTISSTTVPGGSQGTSYAAALVATGGTPPYTWRLASGSLPPGLALSSTGALSGTPTEVGVSSFSAQVADAASNTSTVNLSLPIGASPIQLDGGFENGLTTAYWSQINDSTHATINTNPAYVHSGTYSLQLKFELCGIPFAPALSYTPGGSLDQTTYYVRITGIAGGETTPSAEVSLTVPAGNLLVVTLPPAQATLSGVNIYVGTAAGAERLQPPSPVVQASVWTEPTTGLIAGVAPPTTFTANCGAAAQDQNWWVGFRPGDWDGYPTGVNPIYVRGWWYFKYPEPDGTVDTVMRKLIYLQDVPSPSNWVAVLTSFGDGGRIGLTPACCGTQWYDVAWLDYNAWYEVEFGVVANTPGRSDGSLTLWVNGSQVWQMTGLNIRGDFTNGIGWIMIGQQANRFNYTPMHEFRYVDDVAIDTKHMP
jgi:hypothetical protein